MGFSKFILGIWLLLAIQNGKADTTPEKMRIASDSGATLAAVYLDAGAGAPGVLFFPMCRPDAMEGWTSVARRLQAEGVSSLAIAYPGYGESTRPTASGDQRGIDADAALRYLQKRIGGTAAVGVAGSSCGVQYALITAMRHPDLVRAAVALTGPLTNALLEHVRNTSRLAVFSGASEDENPAPEWARALRSASSNSSSHIALVKGKAHGTDIFVEQPALGLEIADWLAARLKK